MRKLFKILFEMFKLDFQYGWAARRLSIGVLAGYITGLGMAVGERSLMGIWFASVLIFYEIQSLHTHRRLKASWNLIDLQGEMIEMQADLTLSLLKNNREIIEAQKKSLPHPMDRLMADSAEAVTVWH